MSVCNAAFSANQKVVLETRLVVWTDISSILACVYMFVCLFVLLRHDSVADVGVAASRLS